MDPPYLKANLDDEYLEFRIGAVANTEPGIYQLSFKKLGETLLYTDFPPPLQLIVTERLCSEVQPKSNVGVPLGGNSLPIELDFTPCYPTSGTLMISASLN